MGLGIGCEEDPRIGWKVGRGTEGRECFGFEREGMGPVTRRSAVGGGRRWCIVLSLLF